MGKNKIIIKLSKKLTIIIKSVNVGMGIKDPSVWARQAGDN